MTHNISDPLSKDIEDLFVRLEGHGTDIPAPATANEHS